MTTATTTTQPPRGAKTKVLGDATVKTAAGMLTLIVNETRSGEFFADFRVEFENDNLPFRDAHMAPAAHDRFDSIARALEDVRRRASIWFRESTLPAYDIGHPYSTLWDMLLDADHDELIAQVQTPPRAAESAEPNRESKATIASNDTDGQASAASGPELLDIPLEKLRQHPRNPDPSEAEIVDQMIWMQDGRQDEAITVRPLADPIGCFEVLAGKRRTIAAGRLGWETLQARVRHDLDNDQAAVRYLFASNAQRHEDNPLRKALGLKAMIDTGLDPAAAGEVFGIKSRGGVANVLGLLDLPEPWRSRVVSGEIPETAAYAFKPFVEHKPLMKAFEKGYKDRWRRDQFLRKDDIRNVLKRIVEEETRPIDKRAKRYYGYQLGGGHARYFELTPEVEAKLDVVELPLGKNGKKVKVATNAKAFDKLQIPLIKQKLADKKAGKKPKAKAGDKLTAKEQAAESKRKRKEADQRLADWVKNEWLPAFQRLLSSQAVRQLRATESWRFEILLVRLLVELGRDAPLDQFEAAAAGEFGSNDRYRADMDHWRTSKLFEAIDIDGDPVSQVEEIHCRLVGLILWPRDAACDQAGWITAISGELPFGQRMPNLSTAFVKWIANFVDGYDFRTTIAAGWNGSAGPNAEAREMVTVLLNKMNRPQLSDLAKEICGKVEETKGGVSAVVWVDEAKTKAEQVTRLLHLHRTVGGRARLAIPKLLSGKPATKAKTGRKNR